MKMKGIWQDISDYISCFYLYNKKKADTYLEEGTDYRSLQYENVVKAMEGSFVKLKIAEKEERLKIDLEKKIPKPVNGIVQKDGKYYLVRLEMELEKLKSLINEAESDRRLSQITEEASGKIRNAIGKAQLLITKKFKQFEELCRDNIEDNPDKRQNEMETKSSDLQGYWEMMFTQIDDVKALFSHIEELKANNWKSKEDVPETQKKINSPISGSTPDELFLGHKIRSTLQLMKPDSLTLDCLPSLNYVESKFVKRVFSKDENVFIRLFNAKRKWIPGIILCEVSDVMYTIKVVMYTIKVSRHVDQIIRNKTKLKEFDNDSNDDCVFHDYSFDNPTS